MGHDARNPVFVVSDQVPHKPACAAKEYDKKLEIFGLEEEGLYYLCSENKGDDQLHSYCEAFANLHLCFRICRLLVFS